jgi:transposase
MWCVGELDDEYIARMEDVLSLYAKPYNLKEPVVCFDEKSVQLLDDIYPVVPVRPGRIARRDHEYVRCGTANEFCSVEPRAGRYFLKVTQRRTATDFAEVLKDLAGRYPKARTIHLVLDNLNTHCLKSVIKRFGERRGRTLWKRFTVHYTPKHASWLNQAEIAISVFSGAVLRHKRYPTIAPLRHATAAFQKRRNAQGRPFDWRFTVADARRKFRL